MGEPDTTQHQVGHKARTKHLRKSEASGRKCLIVSYHTFWPSVKERMGYASSCAPTRYYHNEVSAVVVTYYQNQNY